MKSLPCMEKEKKQRGGEQTIQRKLFVSTRPLNVRAKQWNFVHSNRYLIRVEFTQGLDGQQPLLGLPAQTQGQNLQAAFLQGLDPLVQVIHGLGLVLRAHGNRQRRREGGFCLGGRWFQQGTGLDVLEQGWWAINGSKI